MCKLSKIKEDKCCLCRLTFVVCLVTALSLIVGGFFVPPMGVIDGSVLTAVGELVLFPTLIYGYRAIELGYEVKIKHGETEVQINNKDENE